MNALLPTNAVSVTRTDPAYPATPPFDGPNPVYDAVLATLRRLFGVSKGSNPLGKIVRPGFHVVLKPNFVSNRDRHLRLDEMRLQASSTHPSVIRPILDLLSEALEGKGSITIVDSPIEGSDIQDTLNRLGFLAMLDHLSRTSSVPIRFLDLRDFTFKRHMAADNLKVGGVSVNLGLLQKVDLPGDPLGYTLVDLGSKSALEELEDLAGLAFHRSRPRAPRQSHRRGVHLYSIANTVLQADLIINLPKIKTHKKAGITIGMKSTIGLTNRKTWLPHFRSGSPPAGDEFRSPLPPLDRVLWKISRLPLPGDHSLIVNLALARQQDMVMDGSWQGNDTLWRTVFDQVRAVLYADREGRLHPTPRRLCLTLADGIIAGEGDGPIRPTPKPAGILVAGMGMAAVDAACCRLMGFSSKPVRTVLMAERFFQGDLGPASLDKIHWLPKSAGSINLHFQPPSTWPDLADG